MREWMWLSQLKSLSRGGFGNLQNVDITTEITVTDLDLEPWIAIIELYDFTTIVKFCFVHMNC